MLNALRASVMLLVLVGTAHAGEIVVPPAPQQQPSSTLLEPAGAGLFYAETATFDASDSLAAAALELLAILPALV
jgi:hypothetical protein